MKILLQARIVGVNIEVESSEAKQATEALIQIGRTLLDRFEEKLSAGTIESTIKPEAFKPSTTNMPNNPSTKSK